MKKMRIPLLGALAVAVVGIIFGTFFDLEISKAIASPSNNFALTISAIGPTIGFAGVALMGGGFIALAIHGKYHIVLKILLFVLAASCFAVSIAYPAGEYFGINGFYHPNLKCLGYLIVVFPEAAAVVGGYFLFKNCENKNLWVVFCVIIVLLLIGLLAIIPNVKDSVRRPRFRFLLQSSMDYYKKWYQPCKNLEDIMVANGLDPKNSDMRDHFKSYPSGHTAEASILFVCATFFPLASKKFEKYQMPAFYFACGLVALVALSRIMAAAHFLSDVSWGATIILSLTIIANEVVMRVKALQLPEEGKEE